MSYLKRMFDAPQRRVLLKQWPQTSRGDSVDIEFQIQGVRIESNGSTYFTEFIDMVDQGVRRFNQPQLTTWQRLKRVPAPIGSYLETRQDELLVTLWTDPELVFGIDRSREDHEIQWRELFGLVRAAGFCLNNEKGAG